MSLLHKGACDGEPFRLIRERGRLVVRVQVGGRWATCLDGGVHWCRVVDEWARAVGPAGVRSCQTSQIQQINQEKRDAKESLPE